ncbi:hypothetical protein ACIP98_22555 [Streptomyces sp. NPDC088354]|uniref:hypothetical protein n=1 Tax=unclassified Streptomyces TaxID=2593676 RepID=UPI0029B64908|nr:hypothetical protein [Streptomyces sp. MI02-7b]MDX3074731.1 hypothetical protein [Streptomyces sp. MI02-7b]
MSLISVLARAEAMATGRATPLATVRHRHLSDRPLVLVLLTTAGEVGAPLGALVGSARTEPRLLTVPQPRDRDLRFAFLAELAQIVLPYLESFADDTETEPATRNREESEVCTDAPQLLVANSAAVDYVRLLGRSTRFRRTAEDDPDEPHPVPARVPLLGRWLTHYGERARTPGSSLLLSATELLTRHWATGQSNLEDQHLGALLAWIDPPEDVPGAEAARRAESVRGSDGLLECPPAGPATDPVFDNAVLAPATARFDAGVPGAADEIAALLAGQMRPTWDAIWRSLDLLRELPEGAHVEERWKRDRWSYTSHRDRVRAGEPPQPRRDDAVSAAQKLAGRETAQVRLEAQEALDDPLEMAGRRLAGQAFAGEVVDVRMAMSEGKIPKPRPLVTVATEDRPHLDPDAKVYRALPDGRTQQAQFVEWAGPGAVLLRVVNGMGRSKVPDPGTVPESGDATCWTLFEHAPRGGAGLPDPEDTPWTHGGPPGAATAAGTAAASTTTSAALAESADPATAEDYL